jgi:hypothetical protein
MKRLLNPLLVIITASVATLLLFEILLRGIGFSAPVWYRPDAQLGWTLRPGVATWQTKEGRAFVEANTAGWRDTEHAVEKTTDVYRIAVLGDSYSEAMQVARDKTFWALLPEQLSACNFAKDKRIEVLNFGISGYGTAQEYLVLESKAMLYHPDLVLLQFTNGNDVRNNSKALEEDKLRPFYTLNTNGTLKLDDSFEATPGFRNRATMAYEILRQLSDNSRVVQLVQAVRSQPLLPQVTASPAGAEQGLEAQVLAPPRDSQWEDAWQITEKLMTGISEYARRNDVQFLAVTVPYAIQVHPDPLVREAMQSKLDVPDLFYPDRRIAALSQRVGFGVVLLAPSMQRLAESQKIWFHGFNETAMGRGHWNTDGHQVAAGIIARHLCENDSDLHKILPTVRLLSDGKIGVV